MPKQFFKQNIYYGSRLKILTTISTRKVPLRELCINEEEKELIPESVTREVFIANQVQKWKCLK